MIRKEHCTFLFEKKREGNLLRRLFFSDNMQGKNKEHSV